MLPVSVMCVFCGGVFSARKTWRGILRPAVRPHLPAAGRRATLPAGLLRSRRISAARRVRLARRLNGRRRPMWRRGRPRPGLRRRCRTPLGGRGVARSGPGSGCRRSGCSGRSRGGRSRTLIGRRRGRLCPSRRVRGCAGAARCCCTRATVRGLSTAPGRRLRRPPLRPPPHHRHHHRGQAGPRPS